MLHKFKKPEYYLNPKQIWYKIFRKNKFVKSKFIKAKTVWNNLIMVDPLENIGISIVNMGLYDLPVTEALWQIAKPGDKVLDIGANIGYTTILLSERVKEDGSVFAFEPNKNLFEVLNENISNTAYKNIVFFPTALSNTEGEAFLTFPEAYKKNNGLAYVSDKNENNNLPIKLQTMVYLKLNKSSL
jgi:FkbM family methyltransferase